MFNLGKINRLQIQRFTTPGAFLANQQGDEVLLPNKYIPKKCSIGESIDVFVYRDSEDRFVATTLTPLIQKDEFAVLKVKDVNNVGAFLDWGLEKDLLVPFREQNKKMESNRRYLVFLLEDEKTNRLLATAKVNRHYQNEQCTLKEGDQVSIMIADKTELGTNVVIENKFRGLLFDSENFADLMLGDFTTGYIRNIRPDYKIDVSLRKIGLENLEEGTDRIIQELKLNGGYLSLHDKSDPEDIQLALQMSKKNFKRSVGILFKRKVVAIEEDGIRLIK